MALNLEKPAFYCSYAALQLRVIPVVIGHCTNPPNVGYAQSGLQSGGTMVAPKFLPINGETIALETLVPTGNSVSDNVSVQTLDEYGYTVGNYMWVDWAAATPCWIDADTLEPVSNISFAPGQGLWVFGSASDQGLQSVGKVGINDVVVQLRSGGTGTGNPFPVSVTLDDILPEGTELSDNVSIQTLDEYGYTQSNYMWVDWAAANPCWIDADTLEPVSGVTFVAGQGLWVFGSSDAQSIRFPAPEL